MVGEFCSPSRCFLLELPNCWQKALAIARKTNCNRHAIRPFRSKVQRRAWVVRRRSASHAQPTKSKNMSIHYGEGSSGNPMRPGVSPQEMADWTNGRRQYEARQSKTWSTPAQMVYSPIRTRAELRQARKKAALKMLCCLCIALLSALAALKTGSPMLLILSAIPAFVAFGYLLQLFISVFEQDAETVNAREGATGHRRRQDR